MTKKQILMAGFIIGLAMARNSKAYDYSQEYNDCMSNPQTVAQVELNCVKEEHIRVLRQLDETQKKLETMSYFSGLVSTGNTLNRQKENYQKYINSFCAYSAHTECPDYKTPAINKEECLLKFDAVLLEAWQDILNAAQKKTQPRW